MASRRIRMVQRFERNGCSNCLPTRVTVKFDPNQGVIIMATTIKNLECTDREKAEIISEVMTLKKNQIGSFLVINGVSPWGLKGALLERIDSSLHRGTITLEKLVAFLDRVTPWGKQDVYLYSGPPDCSKWKHNDWVVELLKKHAVEGYLNTRVPLVLPPKLELSSIMYDSKRLRIVAVCRRLWRERAPEYDDRDLQLRPSAPWNIEFDAYTRRTMRGMVAFDWDLIANTGFLQISQLPPRCKHEKVRNEFAELVRPWLNLELFNLVDLRPAIASLHLAEEAGRRETISHVINYRTRQGRQLEAKSASSVDSVLGERVTDAALDAVREVGVGHHGNFYFRPTRADPTRLRKKVHVKILGAYKRINFPTSNSEHDLRYVLSRIRYHCSPASRSA
jgi:hypothetical protein